MDLNVFRRVSNLAEIRIAQPNIKAKIKKLVKCSNRQNKNINIYFYNIIFNDFLGIN